MYGRYKYAFQLQTWSVLWGRDISIIRSLILPLENVLLVGFWIDYWEMLIDPANLIPVTNAFSCKSFDSALKIAFSCLMLLVRNEHNFFLGSVSNKWLGLGLFSAVTSLVVFVCCLVLWGARILELLLNHGCSKCLQSVVLAENSFSLRIIPLSSF